MLTKLKDSKQSFDLVKKSETGLNFFNNEIYIYFFKLIFLNFLFKLFLFILEKKIKILSDFSNYIESIMTNKQTLIMRLKEPFVGEHINIEPEYRRYLFIYLF